MPTMQLTQKRVPVLSFARPALQAKDVLETAASKSLNALIYPYREIKREYARDKASVIIRASAVILGFGLAIAFPQHYGDCVENAAPASVQAQKAAVAKPNVIHGMATASGKLAK